MTSERMVVGYARLSKGDDLATQVEDIQRLADQRGLKLAHIYRDESISAADLHGRGVRKRPDFDTLMHLVGQGRISHILVRATDRLIRSRRERVDVYEALARHSVSLLVARGMDVDLSTASGRLAAGILAEVAAHEVEVQSERTQRALQHRRDQGLPPTAGRAFGFTADGLDIYSDAEEAAVQGAFTAFLASQSVGAARRALAATGLTTTQGNPWTDNATRHLLRNWRYAALWEDADGKLWPLKSPRIVDEDVVRAARAILRDPSRRTSTSNASRWALSSWGDCGACGTRKVTSGSRGGGVPIYRCDCGSLGRMAQPVDDYLRALVAAVVERDRDDLMPGDSEDPAVAEARDAVTAGRIRLDQLAELVGDGTLDPAAYAAAVAAVNARLTAAQDVLDGAYQDAVLVGVADALDVRAAVDALDISRFRRVLAVLFASITVLPAAGLPKTLGFQPQSLEVVLASGKARPPVAGETVTLTLPTARAARELATVLRTGGWSVDVRRGGRLVVPADAAAVAQQVQDDEARYGLTYDLQPDDMVRAAVKSFVAGAPELTDDQRAAVRAALA